MLELQGYLTGNTRVPGVNAIPGRGTNVPLYILGSSLYGAQLAAALGLPYAFASHFAPQALTAAVETYRRDFQPSAQLDRPHVIAGVNVIAADSDADAQEQFQVAKRVRVNALLARGRGLTDDEADLVLASPEGQRIEQMVTYSAVGEPGEVKDYLDEFAKHADADELIVALQSPTAPARLRSAQLLADALIAD